MQETESIQKVVVLHWLTGGERFFITFELFKKSFLRFKIFLTLKKISLPLLLVVKAVL